MIRHLLVTNDFPPKIGGIQSYLWELWRRLPADEVMVHTTPHPDAARFDRAQDFTVVRSTEPWLVPGPHLVRRINRLAAEHGADLVVIDPAVPAGLVGPRLERPYAVVVHGAEVAVPGRAPGGRRLLGRVLASSAGVVAAGEYPADEAERAAGRSLPVAVIPPGVDTERIRPLDDWARAAARRRFGIDEGALAVVSVSRLVPRKGMDTLVRAAAVLAPYWPDLRVVIAGEGRDRGRIARLIQRLSAPVRLLGRVPEADLGALYGAADVFAMLCRTRWGGLEQEGFGIVFLEAAAAGVPQVAGRSGGAAEAVADGETGIVVSDAGPVAAARAIGELIGDDRRRRAMGAAARRRAEESFSYDLMARRLRGALAAMVSR